ncbi:MAG: hypothetical protein IJC16_05985 [Rikenellaceae bacterium]|nr:hypothetical protein [Rikenellaceae bacterium]
MKKWLFLLCLPLYAFQCGCGGDYDNNETELTFRNNSTDTVYLSYVIKHQWMSWKAADYQGLGKSLKVDPDRTLIEDLGAVFAPASRSMYDTVCLYVFDARLFESTPRDTLIRRNAYITHYALDESQLYHRDWTVDYPPEPAPPDRPGYRDPR